MSRFSGADRNGPAGQLFFHVTGDGGGAANHARHAQDSCYTPNIGHPHEDHEDGGDEVDHHGDGGGGGCRREGSGRVAGR